MIAYQQALEIISSTADLLPVSRVPLGDAAGTVMADDLLSTSVVPPFDNSAMDGFAVRSADTLGATEDTPLLLRVVGMVTAGEAASDNSAEAATAWEIMTGAPVPAGYDGVIPVEQVVVERDSSGKPVGIRLAQEVAAGRNLRHAGEDFAHGDILLTAGDLIQPSQIMGLAATGVDQLSARRPPRVAAITTGNELTDTDAKLQPGKIHDSNGPYLEAAIASTGATSAGVYRSSDSAEELINLVEQLQDKTDVILTTGGVSAGRMDFVPAALEQLGADILFHRVAIRPGKPILFARLPNGTLVFGLPGNPIAVAVGLRFFVVPAMRRMKGQPDENYATAILQQEQLKKAGLTFFAKAHARTDDSGRLIAEVLPGQESFRIKPLMQANCWAILTADGDAAAAGSSVRIAPLSPGLF
jgi:molybdopterin molybdotransferase